MIESDIRRIETELSVTLPSEYRDLLLHFPVKYDAGTSNGPLWDNVDALISRNRELRTERKSLGIVYRPLPERYFFVGDDGAGWQNLIDLSANPPIVHIMEYENIDQISPAVADNSQSQTVSQWFHAYLLELKNDGIDISSESKPHSGVGWGCIIGMIGFCLLAAIVIALMVAGIQYLTGQ